MGVGRGRGWGRGAHIQFLLEEQRGQEQVEWLVDRQEFSEDPLDGPAADEIAVTAVEVVDLEEELLPGHLLELVDALLAIATTRGRELPAQHQHITVAGESQEQLAQVVAGSDALHRGVRLEETVVEDCVVLHQQEHLLVLVLLFLALAAVYAVEEGVTAMDRRGGGGSC